MRTKHLQSWVAMTALSGFLCVGAPVKAQAAPNQDAQEARPTGGNAIYDHSVAEFDRFLDSHRETAEQLRKEPDLVLNSEFLNSHPELQDYLTQHPALRDQMRKDPNAFMAAEAKYEESAADRDNDRDRNREGDRREADEFHRFLDTHHETAAQLRKQPDLVLNAEFLKGHPELAEYLQQHPAVRDDFRKDPNAFMAQEDATNEHGGQRADNDANRDRDRDANGDRDRDANADRDRDANSDRDRDANGDRDRDANADRDRDADRDRNSDRRAVANFDQFLDSHRETAEQLRRDPSQINNQEFVKSHPALQAYLQQHPEVRQDVSQNPNAFMQQEARYDRSANGMDRDSDSRRQFGEFLGSHSDVSRQLSENPSLVKNHEYMDNHPELRDYLNSHPDVQQRLTADPDNFVKSAQQFNTTTTPGATTKPATPPGDATKTPMPDPTKPKQ